MPRVLARRALLLLTAILLLPCGSALAAPPPNDDFTAAEAIVGAPASATGTTVDATTQTGEPNHAYTSVGRSVWYRWVAPESGTAVVDTVGSAFPTTLAAYTGTTLTGLTRLAFMGALEGERSRIAFAATKDETYYLAVDVDYGSPGAVQLNVAVHEPPPGDSFAAPVTITGTAATVTNDTTHATRELSEPNTNGLSSVWYEWTAPADGAVAIDTAGSAFNTSLLVVTGDAFGALQLVASNDDAQTGTTTSRAGFTAVAGTKYRIMVDGNSARAKGPLALSLRLGSPPANDAFADAALLPSEPAVSVAGDGLGTTAETGEPAHYPYYAAHASAWYSWTAPASGSLTIKAAPVPGMIPVIAAYTGDTLAGLTRVANQAQDYNWGPQQIRIRVQAGVTYRIAVESFGAAGDFQLSLELIDSPVNDDFANALPLAGLSADAAGSTVGATQEPCEPVHDDNYYDPSVWYTWTAPASGGVTIDTGESDFPTVLGIYTGDALCTLTRVPVNRLTGRGLPAKRTFRATAGVTYRIAVDGQSGRTGGYKLALRHSPPPANDLFVNATLLTGAAANVAGSNLGATGEAGEPGGESGATVWYAWTAPSTGPATLKLQNATFTLGLSVYTGAAVDSLTLVKRDDYGSVTFRAQAGATYLIAVDGGSAPNHGDFALDLKHTPSPANDDFAAAVALTGSAATQTGTTLGATQEDGEPRVSYSYGSASVWYSWTAPGDGAVSIDTDGSSFDTVLGVYTGDALGELSTVASNNDVSYEKRTSRVTFTATAGTTYRILVSSYSYAGGEVKLRLRHSGPPANDMFDAAVQLPSAPAASAAGASLGASAETGEPSHYSYDNPRASVWYAWTAPSGGALTIKATSDFQPVIAAYTGSTVTGLTRVRNQAQDWNGGPEQIRVRVEAGTTYYIAIDARGSLGGEFSLSLQLVASPANDDFANPRELVGLVADVVGSTLGATQELCEPVHDDNYYDPSVWFKWTAPESGAVTLDTAGSEFPTVVAVYTGDDLCRLLRIPLRRMSAAAAPAKRGFRAVAGRTYRIVVDGVNAKMGNYKLGLRHAPPPPNDMLADAQELTGATATATGTNFGATAEVGEPGGLEGATVWYSWKAPATGLARVNLPQTDFAAEVGVYSGDTPEALVSEYRRGYYYSYSAAHFYAVEGRTYKVAVDGGSAPAQGDFTLEVASLAAPANDDFADAQSIAGETGSVDGTTSGATAELGEPNQSYYDRGSVWYSWTAPKSGLVNLTLPSGGGYSNNEVQVYTGDAVQSLTAVRGGPTFRATEGTTYRIAVSSYLSVDNRAFRLAWQMIAPPANDAFAAATPLSGSTVSQSGTTVGATREDGEPPSSGYYYSGSGATVWYAWKAPSTGLVSVRTSNGSIGAYRGDSLESLETLASGYYYDTVYFRATAGTTYWLRVEGSDLSSYGSFTLSVALVASPANDDFENAAEFTGSASGTTTGASQEEGEPLIDKYKPGTVWYTWKPATTGTAVVSLPSSYYHAVGVYTGDSLASLEFRGGSGYYGSARFHVDAGTTYRVAVSSDLATYSRTFNLKAEVLPSPPNDNFADAHELTGVTDTATGSNVNASAEPDEPHHAWDSRNTSVWYSWTAPVNGRVTVDLSGSGFDTALSAYEGSAVEALTHRGSDNDSGDGSTSRLTIPVRAGTTYRFAVGGYYGASGAIKLALSTTPSPANDDFSAAVELSGRPVTAIGTNVAATHEPGEPQNYYSSTGGSIWYSWKAEASGRATLDLSGTGFTTTVGVYEGSSVGSLTTVKSGWADATTKLGFDAVRGRTYRISIDGYYGASGEISMELTQADAPPNDDVDGAVTLDGTAAFAAGTNVGATRALNEPNGGYSTASGSVWYRWTAPSSGIVNLNVEGFSYSVLTTAYAGESFEGVTPVAWGSSLMRFYATAGTTYSISVAGAYGATGSFNLRLSLTTPPANDLFVNAKEIAGAAVDVAGSTLDATQEVCEPIHDDNYYDPSVWFSWKAPSDGTVTVDTAGSSFTTVLGIYTGDYLCGLARVAVERLTGVGVPAKRSFRAVKDVTYRIAVDGAGGATGSYALSLRHAPDAEPNQEARLAAPPPEPPAEQGSGESYVEQPPQQQLEYSGDPPSTYAPPEDTPGNAEPPPDPPVQHSPAQDAPPSGELPEPFTPADPPTGLRLAASFPKQRLGTVLSKGLAGDATCSSACHLEVIVTVDAAVAKKARLTPSQFLPARVIARNAGDRTATRFVVRLPKALRAKFAKVKTLPLTVRVVASDARGTAEQTKRLKLKR